jgi:hypothetical protein
LRKKFEKGEIQSQGKDTHVITQAKEKEYSRLSDAFGLNASSKQGSAFDFDRSKEDRLRKLAEKEEKRGYVCEH